MTFQLRSLSSVLTKKPKAKVGCCFHSAQIWGSQIQSDSHRYFHTNWKKKANRQQPPAPKTKLHRMAGPTVDIRKGLRNGGSVWKWEVWTVAAEVAWNQPARKYFFLCSASEGHKQLMWGRCKSKFEVQVTAAQQLPPIRADSCLSSSWGACSCVSGQAQSSLMSGGLMFLSLPCHTSSGYTMSFYRGLEPLSKLRM